MSNNIRVSSLHISTGYGPCTCLRSPFNFRNKLSRILLSISWMWIDLILDNQLLRDHPYSHHTRTTTSTTMCINCQQLLPYEAWKMLLSLNYVSGNKLLNSTNWIVWCERMYIMLQLCEVYKYTQGEIEKPNLLIDPQGVRNWSKNDNYAKHLLTLNISTTKMMNLGWPGTSFKCWKQLLTLYKNKTHNTIITFTCNLHQLWAVNGDNIPKHLVQLRQYFLWINLTANPDFKISDAQFKVIISSTLPQSWDTFTGDYVGQRTDIVKTNPKKLMTSQEFISIIHKEYIRRTGWAEDKSTNFAIQKPCFKPPKPNLTQRISNNTKNNNKKWCSHCKHNNHNDADCHFLNNTPLCSFCRMKGHIDKFCWKKRKKEKDENGKKRKSEGNGGSNAKQKKDVANVVVIQDWKVMPRGHSQTVVYS